MKTKTKNKVGGKEDLNLGDIILAAEICEKIYKIHPSNLAEIIEDKIGGRVKFNFIVTKEDGCFEITQQRKIVRWKGKSYIGDTGPWGFSVAFSFLIAENIDKFEEVFK